MMKIRNNIVTFTQSETNTKKFRNDYPISENLRSVMVNEVADYVKTYAWSHYLEEALPLLNEFVEDHHVMKEKQNDLLDNLFWWQLLYQCHTQQSDHFIENFIFKNTHLLHKKPMILSWLREWDKAIPKFYHVGYKYNDRVLIVTDILEEKTLDVIVYEPLAIPPKQGEIVFGTLIPIGDALYFPIIDFYHFDFEAKEDIARHLHYYYEKHLQNSTMHEAFIHVLSSLLQIERMVFCDNKATNSTR